MPDGLALNYTNMTQAEMRKNGVFDQINASYADKGLYYYARTGEGVQYYIYITKLKEYRVLSIRRAGTCPCDLGLAARR